MIELRVAESDGELADWCRVRKLVVANEAEPTVEDMRRTETPDRLLLLAYDDGELAGSGIAGKSSLGSRAFVAPRVVPGLRRRGVGTALFRRLAAHGASLGVTELVALVDGDDPGSLDFARRLGFEEVDRQVEQVRAVGDEPEPPPVDGVRFVTVAERPELLEAAYPVAAAGYADMATFVPVDVPLEEWLRDEATRPEGSFVALAGDEVIGYAGLLRFGDEATSAEHGLTVVHRDHRRRGLATALKRRQLAWASANGVRRLVTWTQRGNEGMRAVNERLGYEYGTISLTLVGPLP